MFSEWIELLISGSGVIDLPKLTVTGKEIGMLSGSGRLQWDSESNMLIHSYLPESKSALRNYYYSHFREDRRAGTLIQDHDFVQVTGFTDKGMEVTARSSEISGIQPFSHVSSEICKLSVLSAKITQDVDRSARQDYVHAVFEPSLETWSRESERHDDNPFMGGRSSSYDWLECDTGLGKVIARSHHTGHMHVMIRFSGVTSEDRVAAHIDVVQQSMSFLLGRDSILRGYESICSGGKKYVRLIQSPAWRTTDNNVPPPLDSRFDTRDLIEALLACTIELFRSDKGQPVSNLLRLCRDSADNSFESRIAIACICLEGLLKIVFEPASMSDTGITPDEIDRVHEWLKANPPSIGDKLKERMKGLLSNINSRRPIDILHHLRTTGTLGVENEDIQAWKDLRNTAAHARLSVPENNIRKQLMIDQHHRVQTLINKVALHAMQYKGRYIDYGTRGWPCRAFPPSQGTEYGDIAQICDQPQTDADSNDK